jgi:hypothetical protein
MLLSLVKSIYGLEHLRIEPREIHAAYMGLVKYTLFTLCISLAVASLYLARARCVVCEGYRAED